MTTGRIIDPLKVQEAGGVADSGPGRARRCSEMPDAVTISSTAIKIRLWSATDGVMPGGLVKYPTAMSTMLPPATSHGTKGLPVQSVASANPP
jgi:hypothetical protein